MLLTVEKTNMDIISLCMELTYHPGVQDFLYALRENKCPQIEELNLRMSGLSPSSCVLLARAIQEGDLVNSLQVLDWEDNELSYEGKAARSFAFIHTGITCLVFAQSRTMNGKNRQRESTQKAT